MCFCTLYDSPTCGHSWISMSDPCGKFSDLLNCPHRQVFQTRIAPPYTCPTCNRGFADQETIEMVQGPWGCNQLIRGHVGGSHAIPGQWGNISLAPHMMVAAPAVTCGPVVQHTGLGYDHRISGPYPPPYATAHPVTYPAPYPPPGPVPIVYNDIDPFDGGFDYGWDYGDKSRHRHKSKHYHKYRYSSKPSTNCTVM